MRRASHVLPLALVVLAASCRVGPDFVAPTPPTPAAWKSAGPAAQGALLSNASPWWRAFGDDELARLVEKALANDTDLVAAAARVEAARAAAGLARSAQFPTVDAGVSIERERFSGNRATPPGANGAGYTATTHDVGFDLAWELDLFGRLSRTREAAEAAALATEYDRDALALAVAAEVADDWLALRSTRSELAVLVEGARIRREALEMLAGRARAGVGDELDTSRAEAELANVEAERHALERRRAALENALALLCGVAPSELVLATSDAALTVPDVPTGLPSDLLRRRPDVASAVARMHEASARIGVAESESYPRLSLTGTLGFVSADLARWIDASSRTAALGVAGTIPIAHGGSDEQRERAARAAYDERAAAYRGTLLSAFREVEDALSGLETLRAEAEWRGRAAEAARRTLALANGRFEQGLVSQLDVVDAARAELDARRAEVQVAGLRARTTVLLVRALGGGWRRGEEVGERSP